ncbi:MAG: transglycosylase domain-containing protein, partial [Holosporaceae bacterium]|nr:transglycosylase domain-containing protein [Holosporaceae bacterium]
MKVKPMSCIKFALKTMLFLGVGAGVLSVLCVKDFFSFDLPDHNSLKEYSPDLSSRVFLRDGSKLCEYAGERRYFVPVNKVPKKLINAFLSVEDKHFFEHHGIDLFGVARSVVVNLKNVGSGKRPQGASTVTQQVARIFLIKNNEISYLRKVKEAILSYRIENALSKMQILELYLNQIYLGLGSYGVAAAAKTYFNKTIDELSVAECSFLAILAKGANNYHPHRHRDKALLRRNWAINRQFEDGHITLQEKEEALRENLKTAEPDDQVGNCAEYFSEEIRKYLIEKFPFQSLNKEGLIIRTTLDVKFQQCAYNALRKGLEEVDRRFGWRGPISVINVTGSQSETLARLREIQITKGMEEFLKAVVLSCATGNCAILTETGAVGKIQNSDLKWAKKIKAGDVVHVAPTKKNDTVFSLRQLPKVQGAIVVVEADSGRVLAMQGGYSFSGSEFNRATQAKRQTGSAFKPFVYLAGLEHGFAPNSV